MEDAFNIKDLTILTSPPNINTIYKYSNTAFGPLPILENTSSIVTNG